jgi:3-dehydroquinate dehydratase
MYQNSLVSKVAGGVVMGLGADGYRVAIDAIVRQLGAADASG